MLDVPEHGSQTMSVARVNDAVPFDAWLRGQLSERYNAALREPLPEDLLHLLTAVPDRR